MSRALKIVVADDELDMRDYFQQILPLLGHQVLGVARHSSTSSAPLDAAPTILWPSRGRIFVK